MADGDDSDNSATNAGAVYVFALDGPTWSQELYLKATNTDADDGFGAWVDLQDGTLAVSSIREASAATGVRGNGPGDNSAPQAGAVYLRLLDF